MKRAAAAGSTSAKENAPTLSDRESEALRITRELAREARDTPRGVPVRPDRTNKYVAPQ